MERSPRQFRFLQPCAAHEGCRCAIYAERPDYCREFDCALLKSLKAGKTTKHSAMRTIAIARNRVKRVVELLRKLGSAEEMLSLGARFRSTARRIGRSAVDKSTAADFAELTLAMHDLNRLIADEFYPGRSENR